jgi:hypothetical protein
MNKVSNIEPLNLKQLLTNPTGKYSAYMSARYKIIEDLNYRYNKLLSTYQKFKFDVYKVKNTYLFWFKIPSEKYDLYYDVFIQFNPTLESKDDLNINNYILNLFSNSPSFMFTYTYVLNNNGMIVDLLKNKCSKEALTKEPSIRNPVEVYGFEKSCYFACKYISDNKLIYKHVLEQNKKKFDKELLKKCKTQEDKLIEYNKIKKEYTLKRQEDKKELQKDIINSSNSTTQVLSKNRSTSTNSSSGTKSAKTVKKVTAKKPTVKKAKTVKKR